MFKRLSLFLALILLCLSCGHDTSRDIHIIPAPRVLDLSRGHFTINKDTRIQCAVISDELMTIATRLADQLAERTGSRPEILTAMPSTAEKVIVLDLYPEQKLPDEAYFLDVRPDHITLAASTPTGLFYACQSLLQLLPLEDRSRPKVPCVHIQDEPRFAWRGMHLDVSRHFMDVETIKKYLDLLARYKMNVFHWHLTDDQGWRIEIDAYPKLTEIGAWRSGPDGKPYGGFYTKDQVRDIVAYAADRHITVVPEIELPGHCQAALAAYPELSCTGGPFEVSTRWGVHNDVFCAGKEETFEFLETVLLEVMELFPSDYIHIGGDEVPKERWAECPSCQQRILEEWLRDERELQSYFIQRISDFLSGHSRKLIGWEEILQGGIPEAATLQTWRREKTAVTAARKGHDVIMSYYENYYFNRSAFRTALHDVYEYEPIPEDLNRQEASHIIGGECALWTEYITMENLDEYMFPRLPAFAEAFWVDKDQKDFTRFYASLGVHQQRLEHQNIVFGPEAEPVGIHARFNAETNEFYVKLLPNHPALRLYYCFHDKVPTKYSNKYTKPLHFSHSGTFCAQAFLGDKPYGKPLRWKHLKHLALGIPAELEHAYHKKYTAGGDLALTDGIRGSDNFLDGCWQGFEGDDLIAIIDLGKIRPIQLIESSYLQKSGSWIFIPTEVSYFLSDDGVNFERVATLKAETSQHENAVTRETFTTRRSKTSARYVKVHAKNVGTCPDWHHGAGGKAWIFADEIVIQ